VIEMHREIKMFDSIKQMMPWLAYLSFPFSADTISSNSHILPV